MTSVASVNETFNPAVDICDASGVGGNQNVMFPESAVVPEVRRHAASPWRHDPFQQEIGPAARVLLHDRFSEILPRAQTSEGPA
jgi:hypothetical protein